jgi:hypothetical protein
MGHHQDHVIADIRELRQRIHASVERARETIRAIRPSSVDVRSAHVASITRFERMHARVEELLWDAGASLTRSQLLLERHRRLLDLHRRLVEESRTPRMSRRA